MSDHSIVLSLPVSVTEYRDVNHFLGYRVGTDGSVWSCWHRGGRKGYFMNDVWGKLQGGIDKDGYRKLILCANSKRRYVRVATLVLETFVGPCPDGMECCHKDDNNTNDRLDNLRWGTHRSNIADKRRHGTHQAGEKHAMHKFTDQQIREIRARRRRGEKVVDLARLFGVWPGTISAITTRRRWKHVPDGLEAEPGLFTRAEGDEP